MTDKIERAKLGIDGDCGFALLGPDLQKGEAEFERIVCTAPKGTAEWDVAAGLAITKAYRRLQGRLAPKVFSYYLGPSHPRFL